MLTCAHHEMKSVTIAFNSSPNNGEKKRGSSQSSSDEGNNPMLTQHRSKVFKVRSRTQLIHEGLQIVLQRYKAPTPLQGWCVDRLGCQLPSLRDKTVANRKRYALLGHRISSAEEKLLKESTAKQCYPHALFDEFVAVLERSFSCTQSNTLSTILQYQSVSMLTDLMASFETLYKAVISWIESQCERYRGREGWIAVELSLWFRWLNVAKDMEKLLFSFALLPVVLMENNQRNEEKNNIEYDSLLKDPVKVYRLLCDVYTTFDTGMKDLLLSLIGLDDVEMNQIAKLRHVLTNSWDKLLMCKQQQTLSSVKVPSIKRTTAVFQEKSVLASIASDLLYLLCKGGEMTMSKFDDASQHSPDDWIIQYLRWILLIHEVEYDFIPSNILNDAATCVWKGIAMLTTVSGSKIVPSKLTEASYGASMTIISANAEIISCAHSQDETLSPIMTVTACSTRSASVNGDCDGVNRGYQSWNQQHLELVQAIQQYVNIYLKFASMLQASADGSNDIYSALMQECCEMAKHAVMMNELKISTDSDDLQSQNYDGPVLGHYLKKDKRISYLLQGSVLMQSYYLKIIESKLNNQELRQLVHHTYIMKRGLLAMRDAINCCQEKYAGRVFTSDHLADEEILIHQLIAIISYIMIRSSTNHLPQPKKDYGPVFDDVCALHKRWLVLRQEYRQVCLSLYSPTNGSPLNWKESDFKMNGNPNETISQSLQLQLTLKLTKVQLLFGYFKVFAKLLMDIAQQDENKELILELEVLKTYWKPWRQAIVKLTTVIELLPLVQRETTSSIDVWTMEWDHHVIEMLLYWIEKELAITVMKFERLSLGESVIVSVVIRSMSDDSFLSFLEPDDANSSRNFSTLQQLLKVGKSCQRIREWIDATIDANNADRMFKHINSCKDKMEKAIISFTEEIMSKCRLSMVC